MRVPYGWLKEFVADLPDVDEAAARLTMGGIEVESISRPDPRLVDGLVTARIVETAKHPNADRLTLCKVDDGEAVIPIVCGARNMKAGDAVVLAKPGTLLPDGRKIARSKIRGEESRGMLCSAEEIGAAPGADGILILDVDTSPGRAAAALLGIDETIFELSVTPNRGDCLSIRGVARELAALCNLELMPEFDTLPTSTPGASGISVRIDVDDLCPLYTGIEVQGVTVAASPPWLTARLRSAGLRPINNVVDVTNYVLWELGQPLHAFDRALLGGSEIRVARAAKGERLETLDGQARTLEDSDVVIRDTKGVVALAGVMGGAGTAVHSATCDLFLESAVFSPTAVRKTSRRFGLVSDSSFRFERGVDAAVVERALLRAAELITRVGGGKIAGGVARAGAVPSAPDPIKLRPARIGQVLGISVTAATATSALTRLGCEVVTRPGGDLSVTRPSHRHDLEREVDLVEEVARVGGYENIAAVAPAFSRDRPATRGAMDAADRARAALAALGASEVIGLSFSAPRANRRFRGLHAEPAAAVVVENPQGADTSELRRSLLPALLLARATNVRNGVATTDLFSIGRTFSMESCYVEIDAVAGLLAGPRRLRGRANESALTFWHLKSVCEAVAAAIGCRAELRWSAIASRADLHPRVGATIHAANESVGYAGEVHPDALGELDVTGPVFVFELDIARLRATNAAPARYSPVPRFPASSRDVSLIVPLDLPAERVIEVVRGLADPLVEHVEAFDEYTGGGVEAGTRAVAFRLRYRASDRTLTDDEVSATHEKALAAVLTALPVRSRA
jgi:phenylalanyl-tRNA synthetase beta chain